MEKWIIMVIKYFSMFSGIGGFEYGMEKSKHNFECVGYSEIDKYAVSIYEKNYPNHINYGDATEIRTEELPDFDFLVGGFPCQAFSIAGKRKGFNEARGTLFFEIARILRDKKPRYFLLENVKGLLSHDRGRTVQTIFRVCDELRYDVSWAVYNSKDYGVPQNRERIFIKGYFRGECSREVLSIPRVNRTVDEPMSNTHYGVRQGRVHKEDEIMNTLTCNGKNGGSSQLIVLNSNKPQAERIYDSEGLSCSLSSSSGGLGGKTGLYKLNKVGNVAANGTHGKGNVYSDEGISPSILACNYKDNVKILQKPKVVGNGMIVRKLTPVECERLQGFPDNWTKYGKNGELISDTQRYKCCGNAVTTNVITAIVNEMFGDFDE